MSRFALVTGATSGLGSAFCRTLASEGFNLVLVARDKARLESFAVEILEAFNVSCEVLPADLADPLQLQRVEDRLGDTENPVVFLVNNAGFGMKGDFATVPADEHERMLRVNCIAVLRLMHAALNAMAERGNGDIINVSSVAGYTPGLRPSSTYAASKAFVTAMSEGLTHLFDTRGVHISAVCPGYVRTEFHDRAGINMSRLPRWFWLRPDYVVTEALQDHRKGKSISIPSRFYKVIVTSVRLGPRWLYRRIGSLVKNRTND